MSVIQTIWLAVDVPANLIGCEVFLYCWEEKTNLSRVLVTGLRTQKNIIFWLEKHRIKCNQYVLTLLCKASLQLYILQKCIVSRSSYSAQIRSSFKTCKCCGILITRKQCWRCRKLRNYEWILAFRHFLIVTHSCFIVFLNINYFKSTNEMLACEPENLLFSEVWRWKWRLICFYCH